MTWASHMIVGASVAKLFGLSYAQMTFGSILPDLTEAFFKTRHRGISHSVTLSMLMLAVFWFTPFKEVWIGVIVGHLLMDSLTIMGVPILDEKSRKITLFGGKIRTGSAGEFVISGIIAFLAFFIIWPVNLNTTRRDWQALLNNHIIDLKEYFENRFRFL